MIGNVVVCSGLEPKGQINRRFTYLNGRATERVSYLPPAGSPPKRPQWLQPGRSQELHLSLPRRCRGPGTEAITCCSLGGVATELHRKRSHQSGLTAAA